MIYTELTETIDQKVHDDQEPSFRYHLGASIIGRECSREIWYNFRWAMLVKHEGRILRLFNRGHKEEPHLIKLLEDIGVKYWSKDPETGKQFKLSAHGGHYGGSLDGVGVDFPGYPGLPMLGEFKTFNDKWFKDLLKKLMFEAKFEHYVQMQQYMGAFDLTKGVYLAINKNTDELYSEVVDFDQLNYERYLARAKLIINSNEPPPRCNNNPSWFKCKMCDFRPVCHSTKCPAINCRTCCHSTPVVTGDGGWTCDRHAEPIRSEEGQIRGCVYHLFNPHMINKTEVLSGDTESDWLEITHSNLGTIKIGPKHVTSGQLEMLLSGDELEYWLHGESDCWGLDPIGTNDSNIADACGAEIVDRATWLKIASNGWQ